MFNKLSCFITLLYVLLRAKLHIWATEIKLSPVWLNTWLCKKYFYTVSFYVKSKVFLKDGTYTLSTAIVLDDNIVLEGESWEVLLFLANGADTNVIEMNNKSNVVIRNLTVDQNEDNQTDANSGNRRSAIVVEDSDHVTIDHCQVLNGVRFGVYIGYDGDMTDATPDTSNGSIHCDVRNCYVSGACWNGIMISFSTDIRVINCEVTDSSDVGIGTWDAYDCLIALNCVHENNKAEGYDPGGGATNPSWDIGIERESKRIDIIGNICYGSECGIRTAGLTAGGFDCYDINIIGNIIFDEDEYGMIIGRTVRANLNGNYVHTTTAGGGAAHGIWIPSTSSYVSSTGDKIYNAADDGLNIDADGTTVTGITIVGCPDRGIYIGDNVTDTVIVGGRITGCDRGVGESNVGADFNLLTGINMRGNTNAHSVDAANSKADANNIIDS